MFPMRIAACLLALSVASAAFAQAEPAATQPGETILRGKVDAVTVYRGQALVSRNITLPAGTGLAQIVVSELPERLIPNSLFAEGGGDGIEVRSVRYRERPVAQDVREEVRKLDDQILAVNDKLAAIAKQLQVLSEQRTYLDKLESFTAPTANTELTKGVLNAQQLKDLTAFQFDSRRNIADQELKLSQDQRGLQEQVQLLTRQRGEVTGRSSRTLREAIIFINRERPAAPAAGNALHLRYLVDGATWTPSYNVRANTEKTTATLEYQAAIEQLSGEDWNDVSMTLSTATPSLVAAAPSLSPLQIALASPAAGGRGGMGGGGGPSATLTYESVEKGIITLRNNAEQIRNQSGGNGIFDMRQEAVRQQFAENDKNLNRVADQLQILELVTRDSRKGGDEASRRQADEGIVVTYQLRARTTLPSRTDRQLIQIDQIALQSQFYKVAVPVLTSYVYDQADLTNTSSLVLLAGPVASYVGGQFVGSGSIDTVSVGQPFTVGFGIDSSLRATREREEKSEEIQGGNRIVNFTYRLAVENFGTKPADVRLMDRLPVGKEAEVRVRFDEVGESHVSTDKEYLPQRKNGILRWDVHVPAQKNGSEAFALEYKLHLEHDRNLAISTAGLLGPELDELLRK